MSPEGSQAYSGGHQSHRTQLTSNNNNNNSSSSSSKSQMQLAFTLNVRNIFILICCCAQLVSFGAEAGKSKSKSSKTTVIAISGGGGGKPHPMPIPWPVVHCHHHHHHLKYVPKPVLIHHWVKKHPAKVPEYDGIASNEHYRISGEQNALPLASSNGLAVERANGLDYSLDSYPQATSSFATPPSLTSPAQKLQVPFDLIDETHPILESDSNQAGSNGSLNISRQQQQINSAGNKRQVAGKKVDFATPELSNKQLDKLTRTIQTAQQKSGARKSVATFPFDSEPVDSIKDHVMALDNTTTDNYSENSPASNSRRQIKRQRALAPNKPSHPFDEPHDQLKDETAPGLVPSAQPNRGSSESLDLDLAQLRQANQLEESNSRQAFERLARESAHQMAALELHNNRLLRSTRAAPEHFHPFATSPRATMGGAPNIAPLILQRTLSLMAQSPARGASSFIPADLQAISTMTRMASRMAQTEARKLIERQMKTPNETAVRQLAASRVRGPIASLLGGLNVFNRLTNSSLVSSPASLLRNLNSDNKRRESSEPTRKVVAKSNPFQMKSATPSATDSNQVPNEPNYRRFLSWQSTTSAPTTLAIGSSLASVQKQQQQQQQQQPQQVQRPNWPSIRAYQLRPGQLASPREVSRPVQIGVVQTANVRPNFTHSQHQTEKLVSESSGRISDVVDPKQVSDSRQSPNQMVVAAFAGTPQALDVAQEPAPPTTAAMSSTLPIETGETTTASTMSPDLADMFYVGQRDHLKKTTPVLPALMATESPVVSNKLEGVTSSYKHQPSNIHQSIALPGAQVGEQSEVVASLPAEYQTFMLQQQHQQQPLLQLQPQQQQQYYHQRQLLGQPSQLVWPPTSGQLEATTLSHSNQIPQATTSSLLQFPMSPEQWSSEAMRALNGEQQSSEESTAEQPQVDQESNSESQKQQQQALEGDQNNQADEQPGANELLQLQLMAAGMSPAGSHQMGAYQSVPFNLASPQQQQQMQRMQQMQMLMMAQQQQQPEYQPPDVMPFQQAAASPYGYYVNGRPLDQSSQLMSDAFLGPDFEANFHQQLQQSLGQESNFQATRSLPPSRYSQWPSSLTTISQKVPSETQSLGESKRNSQKVAMMNQFAVPPGGPSALMSADLAGPMSELQQVRQFQAALGQREPSGTWSDQLRTTGDQTNLQNNGPNQFGTTRLVQAPQMPQIPNIPQPPQAPNIPMPPPGMMQMAASVALPLAMARMTRAQNRFRNQQVNSAAGGGGSTPVSPGQRLLRGASNLTNRLMRPRRRPATSRPAQARPLLSHMASSTLSGRFQRPTPSSPNKRQPNRSMPARFLQTVVDMSRRPPPKRPVAIGQLAAGAASSALTKAASGVDQSAASSAANAVRLAAASTVLSMAAGAAATNPSGVDKLKPKSDSAGVFRHVRAVRNANVGQKQMRQPESARVVLPGSPLVAVTDGSVHRFESMTSPVDLLNRQLRQLMISNDSNNEIQSVPSQSDANSYQEAANSQTEEPQTSIELLRQSEANAASEAAPKSGPQIGGIHSFESLKMVPGNFAHGTPLAPNGTIPLVANHFNLVMFTAQNVTENLLKARPDEEKRETLTQTDDPSEELPAGTQQEAQDQWGRIEIATPQEETQPGPKEVPRPKSPKRIKKVAVEQTSQTQAPSTTFPTGASPTPEPTTTTSRPNQSSSLPPVLADHLPASSEITWDRMESSARIHLTKRSTSSRPAVGAQEASSGEQVRDDLERHLSRAEASQPGLRQPTTLKPEIITVNSIEQLETDKEKSEADAKQAANTADYVRAIKLIRGVSYPWPPPPTQSSRAGNN